MKNIESFQTTPEDQEALNKLYIDVVPTLKDALRLAEENTQTFTLVNGNHFRATVFTPEHSDGSVIIMPDEFMHAVDHPAGTIRALGVQALNPHATVVRMPNDRVGFGHSYANLSLEENWGVFRHGNFAPYIDRYNAVVDQLPRDSRDENDVAVTGVGLSLGGMTIGAWGADPNTRATGLLTVEAPDVEDRSVKDLGSAFYSSGGQLKEVIAENYSDVEDETTLKQDLLKDLGAWGLIVYAGGGIVRFGNLALVPSMAKNTHEAHITAALEKGISVVTAWAGGDMVSPASSHRESSTRLADEYGSIYEGIEFEAYDHSMTNRNTVIAGLTRRTIDQSSIHQS